MTAARELLADATRRLAHAGVPTARVDAELLLAHVTGRPRALLRADAGRVTEPQRRSFESLVSRRATRRPLQHLTGRAPFRHLELAVGEGVFIPRPESELIVDEVIRFCRRRPAADRILVVDLCTGSAALALAIGTEIPDSDVLAVELDPGAVAWARRNAAEVATGLAAAGSSVAVVSGDATTVAEPTGPLAARRGTADVVVTNPPYIPAEAIPRDPEVRDYDPPLALYGGADGLDVIRLLTRQAALLLRPGGLLVVEHGDGQGWAGPDGGVPGLLRSQSFAEPAGRELGMWHEISDLADLSGRPRHTRAIRAAGTIAP